MIQCKWEPCDQEVLGDSPFFCYFHEKRARGFIKGWLPGPGLAQFVEPSTEVKAMIAALESEDS